MSEAGWLGLATLIINAIGAAFVIWMKFKMAILQRGIDDGNRANHTIIDEGRERNEKLTRISTDVNGGLTERIAAQVKLEVAKALEKEKK